MESTVKYGQEIGSNLKKIGKKLSNNDNLIMLLDNTDLDPLNKVKHPNNIDGVTAMKNKLIRFVPLVTSEEQTTKSKIVLIVDSGELFQVVIQIMKIYLLKFTFFVHLMNG